MGRPITGNTTFIYALADPRTLQIRYVGKSNWPKNRLACHIRDAKEEKSHNSHCRHWIQQLLRLNLRPELVILETNVLMSCWQKREQWWISTMRDIGMPLANITCGGDGLSTASKRTRKLVAEANKRRVWTEESRQKISVANKGHPVGEKQRQAIARANRQRGQSKETRQKISKMRIAMYEDEEYRLKMRKARSKLSDRLVQSIRASEWDGNTISSIARRFGICWNTASGIRNRTLYEWVPEE